MPRLSPSQSTRAPPPVGVQTARQAPVGSAPATLSLRAAADGWTPLQIGLIGSAYYIGFVAGCFGAPFAILRAGHIRAFTAMVSLAAGATAAGGSPRMLAGAFAFYLSDLSVARDRFVREALVNRLWGLPLYYAAQLCLAATI